jgi:zinc D-Ala-D-Ala carboxypeptidase
MAITLQEFKNAIMAGLKKTWFKNDQPLIHDADTPLTTSWPHFSRAELTCQCGCGKMGMDQDFMRRLEELRTAYGRPMVITSAYRCPDHNSRVSKTGRNGPHTKGQAIDILASGENAYELLFFAIGYGFAGLGINQSGPHAQRFIHLDRLESLTQHPRPRVWSY